VIALLHGFQYGVKWELWFAAYPGSAGI